MELTAREKLTLMDVSRYTRRPSEIWHGFSNKWSPKTTAKLHEKGLVEFVESSVVITDKGLALIGKA